ncbi:MAG: PilZ domain-containing protein [Acidobacteria bacterium]|nr:PilZ domain-containing protein [Acidobacteriota bacterium]
MTEERRHEERLDIAGEAPGEVTILQPVSVVEISRGGAQVEVSVRLALDSLHDFRLALGDRVVVVKARIVHCRIAEFMHDQVVYRAGVEFIEPSDHVVRAIDEYLDRLRAARVRQIR